MELHTRVLDSMIHNTNVLHSDPGHANFYLDKFRDFNEIGRAKLLSPAIRKPCFYSKKDLA
jgi:hypothetical protein